MIKVNLKSCYLIDKNTSSGQLLGILLKNRQVTASGVADFIHPLPPNQLRFTDFITAKSLKLAVTRLQQAIKKQENILIYGDYDVDGLSATAVLYQSLLKAGAKVTPFVPDRQKDGYGFNSESFLGLKQHFPLLITVDNGIVATKEFSKIPKTTDIIIVDHHLPAKTLPKVSAIIHSTQFSGSILAWVLAKQFDPSADLGLAVLGMVPDCLPLTGPNRNLVVHGLKSIRRQPCLGLQQLIKISGLDQSTISAGDLAFMIGPRLNAVGRLSSPSTALKLLITNDLSEAAKLSQTLDQHNQDRQSLQQESLALAEKIVCRDAPPGRLYLKNKLIFVSHKSFNPGIIGLIAGNLAEKYYLPAIAVSLGPEVSKGSCRSIKELNIIDALRQFPDLFLELGGHTLAAGFSVKTKLVPKLEKSLTKFVSHQLSSLDLSPSVDVEAAMSLSAAKITNFNAIKQLEPFGLGNPEPLFLFKDVVISQKRLVGSSGNHLKLRLDDPSTSKIENISTDAIAFKKGSLDSQLKVGDHVDIVARLDVNTWNGTSTPQLIVKEIILSYP